MQMAADVVKKHASFDFNCPIRVGKISIRNMTVGFPSIVPFPTGSFCTETLLIGKSKSQRKMETFVSVSAKLQIK
jgi:hypothetical protein